MHDCRTIIIANLVYTTIKNHVIKCCEKVYERSGKDRLDPNSYEILNKLKSRGFCASVLSTYVFFLHYILPCPTILFRIS